MSIKINAGLLRGMGVKSPDGVDTRPTSARVRQAVASMLGPFLPGATLLDLFAGTGAMGLELVSRGASRLVVVEKDRKASHLLRANIEAAKERLSSSDEKIQGVHVIEADVSKCWTRLSSLAPFDIVWIDPPYKDLLSWLDILNAKLSSLTSPGALWVMESDKAIAHQIISKVRELHDWQLYKQRNYGKTLITILIKLGEVDSQ